MNKTLALLVRALRTESRDIKSHLFLARMTVRVNEVTRNATVVLQRNPSTGKGDVLYFRVL